MKYKLIAIDLDGTLDNDHKEVDIPTRDALLSAQRQGIRLLLASARPLHGLFRERDILEMTSYHGLLMAYNGGLISDCSDGAILSSAQMDPEQARQILKMLESFPVTPILDDGSTFYAADEDAYMVRSECRNNNMPFVQMQNLSENLFFAPYKILMSADPVAAKTVQREIAALLPSGLCIVQTAPFYLEIIPGSVNKGAGLRTVCETVGIDLSQTIAFGDSENDAPMLRVAGVGIAMGNADDSVKRVADMVTASNNDNGIAAALKKIRITAE